MAFDYDLFVIGGGSGGVRAARVAAGDHGAKVALAEEYRMGGTCVIRGCVPKKLMVFASEYGEMAADAQAYGWDMEVRGFDWTRFHANLEVELNRLEGAYRNTLRNAGVQTFDQRATVVDPHTVALADGTRLTARHILIAVGGRPFVPEFEGSDLAITSNEIFHLSALPTKALIVGGGYIASEFACILNGLGVETHQYYRGDQILRGFDQECRTHIATQMQADGVRLRTGTDIVRLEREGAAIRATATDGSDDLFDVVMYATGRVPNTDSLGLEGAGVHLGRKGEVVVDDYSQTNIPSVFAVGDVTDRIALTPIAIREGHAFADTMFGGQKRTADWDLVPSAVFTQPEFGTVGLSEEDAAAKGPIEVYVATFRPMQTLFAGRQNRVLMKLVVCAQTRVVLGCHIVAPHAGEMIQMAGIAVKMGATKEDFDRTVAVHPSMSEELVTMRKPVRKT
ncbi:glutathione-disulfide reductase [Falsirhodobacter halotolerans]|uniref:glutathione-disulfide reductase n=1 Tax=Falsirhodobacter halotolerans TaxID=1146892 RepID=UPI001FD600F9|nr:glutathione-disulfide reductase [Falsirhodobacter halotolerans]MCJ8138882.1 glutathione-disulfide reductase [Falsirhodobacter halotolerans]